MESEEAIMENENNSNVESESINRERGVEEFQQSASNLSVCESVPEANQLDSPVTEEHIGSDNSAQCIASTGLLNQEESNGLSAEDTSKLSPRTESRVKDDAPETAVHPLGSRKTGSSLDACHVLTDELQENNTAAERDISKFKEDGDTSATGCDEPMDVSEKIEKNIPTINSNSNVSYVCSLHPSSAANTKDTVTSESSEVEENVLLKGPDCQQPVESAIYGTQEREMSTEILQEGQLKNKGDDCVETEPAISLSHEQEREGHEEEERDTNQNIDEPIRDVDEATEDEVDLIEDPTDSDSTTGTTQKYKEYSEPSKTDETSISPSDIPQMADDSSSQPACEVNKEQSLSEQKNVEMDSQNPQEDADQGSISQNSTTRDDGKEGPNFETISNKDERREEVSLDNAEFENQSDYQKEAQEGETAGNSDDKINFTTERNQEGSDTAVLIPACIDPTTDEIEQDPSIEAAEIEQDPSIEAAEIEQDPSIEAAEIEQDPSIEAADVEKEDTTCIMETDEGENSPQNRNSNSQYQWDSEKAKMGDTLVDASQEKKDRVEDNTEETVEPMETITEEMAAAEKMSTDTGVETLVEQMNVDESPVEREDSSAETNCKTTIDEQTSVTNDKALPSSEQISTGETVGDKAFEGLKATETTVANIDDLPSEQSRSGLEINSETDADKISTGTGYNIHDVASDEMLTNTEDPNVADAISENMSGAESDGVQSKSTAEEETVKDSENGANETAMDSEDTSKTAKDSEDTNETAKDSEDTNETAKDSEDTNETAKDSEDTSKTAKDSEDTNETAKDSEDTNETAKDSEDTNETAEGSEGSNQTAKDIEKSSNKITKDSEKGTNGTARGSEESTNETAKDGGIGANESTGNSEITANENANNREIGTNESGKDSSISTNEAPKDNEETLGLLDAKNIKQELMSDEDSSTSGATDAKILQMIKKEVDGTNNNDVGLDQEDIVVLDDEGESFPVKREPDTMNDSNLIISSVSGHENSSNDQANSQDTLKTVEESGKGGETKRSKTKMQTCIVCSKVCRCKYNIVRNGDVKHLCGDDCFKRFRKTPSAFLKNKDGKPAESPKTTPKVKSAPHILQDALSKFKSCSVCQLMQVNPSQPFCNWKGMDFCGESCLGKFQANLSTACSFCGGSISAEMRATFCLKIGNDVRIFCQSRCVTEFRKNLRLCACCQKDLSSFPGAFSAMVGSLDKKIRQFCSQTCRQKLETQLVGVEVVSKTGLKANNNSTASQQPLSPGSEKAHCAVCQKLQAVQHTVRFHGKVHHLCGNLCLSAFKYTNKIGLSKCDTCGTVCTVEEAQAHYVQFEGQVKRFCSDVCVNIFRRDNNKVMACCWCGAKKINFDMIERLGADNKFQMFCSLNCLSLYRVNLQAKSNQAVACDQCMTVTPAQYHLTMSDASVRNFCSYTCVMTFQAQFTTKQLPPAQPQTSQAPPPPKPAPSLPALPLQPKESPDQQAAANRARIGTRNASKQNSPSFPVISNVVSLAPPTGPQKEQPSPATPDLSSQQTSKNSGPNNNTLSSGDGKHQILIQAPPVKFMKNKSLQCRPVSLTKATSCRPHSQSKETQTEKIPDKQVMVPIPVPIYIPMPTVMYSAPTPIPVPFPIPIPVPVFIPTTRKSAAGIIKTITEIVERMPADPLEAELLMMAEAVAADKAESDSESDAGNEYGADFDDEPEEPVPSIQGENEAVQTKKKDGQGEEDMIQMALRMAEEMSAPIEDLESSVEPVAVNTDPPASDHVSPTPAYQADEDYIPPGSRGRGRGVKRSRGRPSNARPKRQRVEKIVEQQTPPQPVVAPPIIEPAADANYRLKFTYGVNAWRHWVIAKNAQIESTKKPNSGRVRTFPVDILKCTTDELNISLIFFIKEVRKPNGDQYSPDSIYYLCLGIQQYLYENGRIDSIFTDSYFEKFADSLHEILKNLQPKVNAQGQMLCRIEEEHLWESKQLGAHSPFVLLNTLIYFHTKHFILKTAQEHMALSFAQILKHWKKGIPVKGQAASGKNISLRFYCLANSKKDNLAARKSKEGVPVYEITENFDNPLRCPVKLYEFFLSKCPESIKNRNDIFYPVPERSCVPDSPVWYSTASIGHHVMDKMLTRVLLVREIQESHLHAQPIYL